MTVIYFVRHAHSHYTADEYNRPLSGKGFEERDRVTRLFENKNIHTIYSSPYKRAIQTVEGIAQEHKLQIKTIDSFKERILSNLMEKYLILTLPFIMYGGIRILHLRVENQMIPHRNELLLP